MARSIYLNVDHYRHLDPDNWALAKEFDLPPDSTVVVVGSYEGVVMELIDQMYDCRRIVGFDPQVWACARAMDRFTRYMLTTCEVHPWALGTDYSAETLYEYGTDAASMYRDESRDEDLVTVVEIISTFNRLGIDHIDLMIMNCEGGEFELIPYMMGRLNIPSMTPAMNRIDRLAVQFHTGLGNDADYEKIVNELCTIYTHNKLALPSWGYWYR